MNTSRHTSSRCWKLASRRLLLAATLSLLTSLAAPAHGQQFNSDNWWVLSTKVFMGVVTFGEDHSTMYLGYGFAPGWEVDIAPTLYYENRASGSAARYSTTAFVKRLIWENEKQTAGAAVIAGIGQSPSYYQAGIKTEDFKSYWATVPVTIPFFDNTISWDLMPGFSYNKEYGARKETATSFTYSSRVAIYKVIPQSAIVAEVFGATGEAEADAEYKAGVRWERKPLVIALTYGGDFKGSRTAGWELGVMFFSVAWK